MGDLDADNNSAPNQFALLNSCLQCFREQLQEAEYLTVKAQKGYSLDESRPKAIISKAENVAAQAKYLQIDSGDLIFERFVARLFETLSAYSNKFQSATQFEKARSLTRNIENILNSWTRQKTVGAFLGALTTVFCKWAYLNLNIIVTSSLPLEKDISIYPTAYATPQLTSLEARTPISSYRTVNATATITPSYSPSKHCQSAPALPSVHFAAFHCLQLDFDSLRSSYFQSLNNTLYQDMVDRNASIRSTIQVCNAQHAAYLKRKSKKRKRTLRKDQKSENRLIRSERTQSKKGTSNNNPGRIVMGSYYLNLKSSQSSMSPLGVVTPQKGFIHFRERSVNKWYQTKNTKQCEQAEDCLIEQLNKEISQCNPQPENGVKHIYLSLNPVGIAKGQSHLSVMPMKSQQAANPEALRASKMGCKMTYKYGVKFKNIDRHLKNQVQQRGAIKLTAVRTATEPSSKVKDVLTVKASSNRVEPTELKRDVVATLPSDRQCYGGASRSSIRSNGNQSSMNGKYNYRSTMRQNPNMNGNQQRQYIRSHLPTSIEQELTEMELCFIPNERLNYVVERDWTARQSTMPTIQAKHNK